jgi:transcriptional regulator GlxA family with amidase domain
MSRALALGEVPALRPVGVTGPGAATFRFLPDGASALVGLRMDAMTDRHAPLAEICGRSGRQFEERSIHWRTMEERIEAGTEFLLARKPRSAPDPLVRDLVQRIEECRGQVALAALKRSFAISTRQLERRFTLAVGLTPKLFARIMRLSWFAEHAERCADRKLADIAREVGYFDQAHLNHDFKALTGVSPRQYFGAGA